MNKFMPVTDQDIEIIFSPLRGRHYCGAFDCEFSDEEQDVVAEHVAECHGEQMSADLDAFRLGLRPMLYPRVPVRIHRRWRHP